MRKFLLIAAAVVCTLSMSAKTIYLNTGGGELWNKDGATFFAHSWANEQDNADVQLTQASGDIFSAEINDGHNNILFVRMPGGSTSLDWNAKWNQTVDLAIPEGKNQYNITGWGDADGSWSVYGEGGGSGGEGGGEGGGGLGDAYWYYKGEVDKANLDNEELGFNVFKQGKATIDVENEGYIFLIYQVSGAAGVQYMTDGWLGFEVTHATMSNCGICNNGNKLFIPGGHHTLYLYDNGDGTYELSREELPGKKLVDGGEAIENVVYELDLNAPMFDLLGRKVTEDYRGVVIQNGHKFIR